MAKEQFFLDVRRAATLVRPTVQTDSGQLTPEGVARRLQRAALWLTPKCVGAYSPADFQDLPEPLQGNLTEVVKEFAEVAKNVPLDDSPSDVQFHEGLQRFNQLLSIVGEVVRNEWVSAVERFVADSQSWSEKKGWPCQRREKELHETLLDTYHLPQLYLSVAGSTLQLDPIARFVPGALGLVDFAILSPYRSMAIPRGADGWHIHLELGKDIDSVQRQPWNEGTFLTATDVLLGRRQ